MADQRLLKIQLENGYAMDVHAEIPDPVRARVDSHSCYYSYDDGSLSYCTFTLSFRTPEPTPEPQAGLAFGLVLLLLLKRRKR